MHHFTTLPQADQAFGSQAWGHAVFAAVQRLAFEVEAPVQAQPEGAIQHTFGFKAIEGARGGCPGGYIQQLFLGQIQGLLQRRVELPGREAQQQACRDQADLQQ